MTLINKILPVCEVLKDFKEIPSFHFDHALNLSFLCQFFSMKNMSTKKLHRLVENNINSYPPKIISSKMGCFTVEVTILDLCVNIVIWKMHNRAPSAFNIKSRHDFRHYLPDELDVFIPSEAI